MKLKTLLFPALIFVIVIGCSNGIDYSPEHIAATSGRYLYNQDDVIEVFYQDNTLYLNWRGAEKIKPLALDENTFFVEQIYEKLHFVQHPETKERYLSVLSKEDESEITYDYLKVDDSFKSPSMYLKNKEYDKALGGYIQIQMQDSTSVLINEREFNSLGYKYLSNEEYDDAIAVFKINVVLYPDSDNVYDSLGEAFLKAGDSVQAFENYSKALELNNANRRAKAFVEAYKK
ncbi:tetratricopeptide repeat protein [Muriicola sp. Z0-33]|uniref:tetratricopeptide repeat protein n=1 Tax=Muriicola sp. Z0-33 TaxID=2816957 RepID=UPI0022380258|nr:tetratricopeptide repeat protein [Muriicola sp. Z0-33]MCW5515996.1 tetratricopeptide repeat protein [Muriicola sp. Z0-33]